MNSTRNMGLAPNVCPLCRHDPCDCATVAPPLDLSQFVGYTPGDWVDKRGSIQGKDALSVAGEGAIIDVICWIQISNQPRWEADGHLIAHAPAILDRARELEAEVERLTVKVKGMQVDLNQADNTVNRLTTQRDNLARALKKVTDRLWRVDSVHYSNLSPNSTKGLAEIAAKRLNDDALATARAALARVQGDGDKEGGG